jgi:hypothetical protein
LRLHCFNGKAWGKELIFQPPFNFPMLFPSNRVNRIKILGHTLGT